MARSFDQTVILAAPPHTRAHYAAWLGHGRVRASLAAAVVVLVPGAWAVALVWYFVRQRRSGPPGPAR